MFNVILWQNPCILSGRAQSKDWGTDLSTPSKLTHEKSWCNLTLKGCLHFATWKSLSWFHHYLHHHLSKHTCENLPGWVGLGYLPTFSSFTSLTTSKVKVLTQLELVCEWVWLFQPVRFLLNSIINLVIQWCCHFPVEAEWGARVRGPTIFIGKKKYPCLW